MSQTPDKKIEEDSPVEQQEEQEEEDVPVPKLKALKPLRTLFCCIDNIIDDDESRQMQAIKWIHSYFTNVISLSIFCTVPMITVFIYNWYVFPLFLFGLIYGIKGKRVLRQSTIELSPLRVCIRYCKFACYYSALCLLTTIAYCTFITILLNTFKKNEFISKFEHQSLQWANYCHIWAEIILAIVLPAFIVSIQLICKGNEVLRLSKYCVSEGMDDCKVIVRDRQALQLIGEGSGLL